MQNVKSPSASNVSEPVTHFASSAASEQPQPASAPMEQPPPQSEQEVMAGFLDAIVSDLTRRTFQYLEENSEQCPQLLEVAPAFQYVAQAYCVRNFDQALMALYHVYRAVRVLRASNPSLPPILWNA